MKKYRSYKQVTVAADIEYGEEVDFEGFMGLIDWEKAILFGVEFGEDTFLIVGEEDWHGLHIVCFCRPRKASVWNCILGKCVEKSANVKAEKLRETVLRFWPKEEV
jgi:hypothetical protein